MTIYSQEDNLGAILMGKMETAVFHRNQRKIFHTLFSRFLFLEENSLKDTQKVHLSLVIDS